MILHRLDSTGEIEEIRPYVYQDETGRWLASFIVTSFSSFALVETTIEAKAVTGGVRVTAHLETPLSGQAICVVYDGTGRQLGMTYASLNAMNVGDNSIPVQCDSEKAATAKLFLTDGGNSPLYMASECAVTKK